MPRCKHCSVMTKTANLRRLRAGGYRCHRDFREECQERAERTRARGLAAGGVTADQRQGPQQSASRPDVMPSSCEQPTVVQEATMPALDAPQVKGEGVAPPSRGGGRRTLPDCATGITAKAARSGSARPTSYKPDEAGEGEDSLTPIGPNPSPRFPQQSSLALTGLESRPGAMAPLGLRPGECAT